MNLSRKIFGVAGAMVVCAGAAFGQVSFTANPVTIVGTGATFIRAEGQTELLPSTSVAIGGAGVSNALNATVFITPGVAVTSKVLSSATGATEAIAIPQDAGGTQQGVASFGVVTGSSVSFTGIQTNALTTKITFANIRINASGIPTAVGQPPTPVTEQIFFGGTNVTPGPASTTPTVAYALNGLGNAKITKDAAGTNNGVIFSSNLGVCNAINAQAGSPAAPTPAFYVQVGETPGFPSAFRSIANEASQVSVAGFAALAAPPPAAASPANAAVGFVAGASNAVTSGTRVKISFANVPTGLQAYAPTTVTAADGAVLTLEPSETGPSVSGGVPGITGQSNISSLNGTGVNNPLVALGTNSGTTTTLVYEVTTDNVTAVDTFAIPVFLIAGSNTLAVQSSALAVTISLAPTGPTSIIPSFSATASSATTTNTYSFVICQTTLLFPFVTNTSGFETGIAISNTSKDPGLSNGAKPQSGDCKLSFYGTSGTQPTSVTAPNTTDAAGGTFAAGETYAFTLSSALALQASGPQSFQGYMFAVCNFQNAHGFAYIAYGGLGTPSGNAMGYLALVTARGSSAPEVVTY